MNDLLIRIKSLNTVYVFHITGSSFFELYNAIISIAPVFPSCTLFLHCIHHARRGHIIRFSYAEVYQLCARICPERCGLCPLYLLKLVYLIFFAELTAAYPLSK